MTGPDGTLPLLNDAWEGPSVWEAASPEVSVLRSSGYIVLRTVDIGDQAILDVGPMAPPHLPPHAHADLLSFVLWAGGRPVIVDPGSFTYTGPERRAFRGTAAHNTVEVDGCDQCELWGDFRAAFMPNVTQLDVQAHGDITVVTARHDGYRRLDDPVTHQRAFVWLPRDGLVIIDRLVAGRPHQARSRLHLAPGLSGSLLRVGPFDVQTLGAGTAIHTVVGQYSPFLGVKEPIDVLQYTLCARPHELFGWALLRAGARAAVHDDHLRVECSRSKSFLLDLSSLYERRADT